MTIADAIRRKDSNALKELANGIIKPVKTNFVERPWGGHTIRGFKNLVPLPDQKRITGFGLGEAFEIAAFDADQEARQHPSIVRFVDESTLTLPTLLEAAGAVILGDRFTKKFGTRLPLLPKILDIAELLSVQAHPEGNTEVYVIIEAEEGATIRLGFRHDIEPESLKSTLKAARQRQEALLQGLQEDVDWVSLQSLLTGDFSRRTESCGITIEMMRRFLRPDADMEAMVGELHTLKKAYWKVLDLLNEIPVRPGQVIYNANPKRVTDGQPGSRVSAEVHALGNPEGKEILALEIRRPGPTYRAWDHVRFPLRDLDIDTAVASLNLTATTLEDFVVRPQPVPDCPGVFRSVESDCFIVEHVRARPEANVIEPGGQPHTLHGISGTVELHGENGDTLGHLTQGESAIIPYSHRDYCVGTVHAHAEVVKVTIPV